MQAEIDAHKLNNTWDLTTLPLGQHAITARWLLCKKLHQLGHTKFKASNVTCGNKHRAGIDYEETFAPIVKWSTIRLIVALVSVQLVHLPHGCHHIVPE